MNLRPKDVLSYQGRDFIVEGLLTFRLDAEKGAKKLVLARAADGDEVRWVEPLTDDLDDRILWMSQVQDLEIASPPPSTIHYKKQSYMLRLTGKTLVDVTGKVPDRLTGACELWRYRAAGDLFLQIEKWSDGLIVLAGESVHKNMIEVLPGT
jgi:hypothetical protein